MRLLGVGYVVMGFWLLSLLDFSSVKISSHFGPSSLSGYAFLSVLALACFVLSVPTYRKRLPNVWMHGIAFALSMAAGLLMR